MPLILKKSESYSWPVAHKRPVDGGQYETQQFDASFKRLKDSKLKDLIANGKDAQLVREILVGWKGITADDGSEFPFSQTARDEVIDSEPNLAKSIVNAYLESLAGAAIKN